MIYQYDTATHGCRREHICQRWLISKSANIKRHLGNPLFVSRATLVQRVTSLQCRRGRAIAGGRTGGAKTESALEGYP